MEYGQKLMNRPGTVLNITAGQIMKDVAFKLTPAGTVTGRIVDELGEPLPGLTVQILRSTYDQNGKRTLQPTSTAKTNDLGEYRVYFVPPGRYFVSALAAAPSFDALLAAAANPGGGANTNEVVAPGYVQTYFPNTTDYTRASAIEVLPGSEVSAMNFTMVRQQRFHIKGHVIDLTTGKPPQVAQLVTVSAKFGSRAESPGCHPRRCGRGRRQLQFCRWDIRSAGCGARIVLVADAGREHRRREPLRVLRVRLLLLWRP